MPRKFPMLIYDYLFHENNFFVLELFWYLLLPTVSTPLSMISPSAKPLPCQDSTLRSEHPMVILIYVDLYQL